MIKLKNIVNEIRSVKISKRGILSQIKQNFNTAAVNTVLLQHKSVGPLFRSIDGHPEPYYIINPSKHTRQSRTNNMNSFTSGTNNFHTALIDILPSWKDWPKRSKSVIFTNSSDDSGKYGDTTFFVLPINAATICVCLKDDFWESFKMLNYRMKFGIDSFNSYFETLFGKFYEHNLLSKFYDFNGITALMVKDMLEEASEVSIEKIHSSLFFVMSSLRDDIVENYKGNWLEYFDELMNPSENGFQLVSVEEAYKYKNVKEMFTESICMLIDTEGFPSL